MRQIKKILLIQPPYTIRREIPKNCQIPLGLAYLASTLKDEYEVKIIDAIAEGYEREEELGTSFRYGLSFTQLKEKIKAFSPNLVGVSCLFSTQWENAKCVAQIVKEIDKEILIVAGGAHPSAVPEEVLANSEIDYVIVGEGEEALKKLIKDINNGVRGEGIRRGNFIEDLDTIPFPSWSYLPMERYFAINKPHAGGRQTPNTVMITSRGCPYHCVFCSIHSVWGKRFRHRSVHNIIAEMETLIGRYGIKEIQFEDDNILFDQTRAEGLFEEMIKRKLNLSWTVPNGISAEKLDRGLLEKMRESGCYSIFLAIESGREETLKEIIKKKVPLGRIKSLVKEAKNLGMNVSGFFVVGLPSETKANIKETFSFASRLSLNEALFFYATPYPGTPLYTQALSQRLLKDIDYKDLCIARPVMGTGQLSQEKLERLVEREKKMYRIRSVFYGWLEEPLYHFSRFIRHPVLTFKRLRDYFNL